MEPKSNLDAALRVGGFGWRAELRHPGGSGEILANSVEKRFVAVAGKS
jgi:hypothetical protein